MLIENIVSEVCVNEDRLPSNDITNIIIHRAGVDHRLGIKWDEDGVGICRKYIDDPEVGKYTGFKVPYHFIVGQTSPAPIWQCLPLNRKGSHAKSWNSKSIGVAMYGDFRSEEIPPEQLAVTAHLCAMIMVHLGRTITITAHTALRDATRDPNKRCPGDHFDEEKMNKMAQLFLFTEKRSSRLIQTSA